MLSGKLNIHMKDAMLFIWVFGSFKSFQQVNQ